MLNIDDALKEADTLIEIYENAVNTSATLTTEEVQQGAYLLYNLAECLRNAKLEILTTYGWDKEPELVEG